MALRDLILQAKDLARELVKCPEWGVDLYIRAATGRERDEWEGSNVTVSRDGKRRDVNLSNARARLVVKVCEDEAGARVFGDDDTEALGRKSGAVLDRLYDVACRLAGVGAEKNSEPTPSGVSSTGSPPSTASQT